MSLRFHAPRLLIVPDPACLARLIHHHEDTKTHEEGLNDDNGTPIVGHPLVREGVSASLLMAIRLASFVFFVPSCLRGE